MASFWAKCLCTLTLTLATAAGAPPDLWANTRSIFRNAGQPAGPANLPAHAQAHGARLFAHNTQPVLDNDENIRIDFLPGQGVGMFIAKKAIAKHEPIQGHFVWKGSVDGKAEDRVSFVVSPQGTLYGNVWLYQDGTPKQYVISPAEDGTQSYIYEAPVPNLPEDGVLLPPSAQYHLQAQPIKASRRQAADAGNVFDVIMVYSPAVLAAYGQTTLNNMIVSAVSDMNLAYANSQIPVRANLVYSGLVNYTETGTMGDALSALKSTSDGKMDIVHELRQAYRADFVQLIVEDTDMCGLGYLMSPLSTSFATYAFSTVYSGCLNHLTPAHEIGHNQGSDHDRDNGGSALYPYSYGYRYCNKTTHPNAFRTVMSYNCGSIPRIPYFSNPAVSYSGYPTGVDEIFPDSANNAKSITQAAYTFCNFVVATGQSVPAVPTGVAATTNGVSSVQVTWNNVASEAGYRIYQSANGGATWSEIATVPLNTVTYTATGLVSNTVYQYKVQSFNRAGNSADSAVVTVTVAPAPTPKPAVAPTGVTTTFNPTTVSVQISWVYATTDPVTSFQIWRQAGVNAAVILTDLGSSVRSYVDSTVVSGNSYTYYVTAVDSVSGISATSTASTISVVINPPAAPANLVATATGSNTVSLSWTDAAVTETGYNVYRSLDGVTLSKITAQSLAANTVSYSDASLNPSTIYYYVVRAFNAGGDSVDSNMASATTQARVIVPVSAPTSVTATKSTTSLNITLKWTPATTGAAPTSFQIWKQTGAGVFQLAAEVAPTVTNYVDTSLVRLTTYSYYVRAIDSVGGTGANSVTVSATTGACNFDKVCSAVDGETCSNCPDCKIWKANDGICEGGKGENCQNSPNDCKSAFSGKAKFCCGPTSGSYGGAPGVGCSNLKCGGPTMCTTTCA